MTMPSRVFLVAAALPLLFWGCGPSTPPPPVVKTPEQLMADWASVAAASKENLEAAPKACEISQQLAAQGPDKLMPLLDVLSNPNAGPHEKVLVVIATGPLLTQAHEQKLLDLSGPQTDSVSRGCATHLLGALQQRREGTPQGLARLRELMNDPDRHVRSAAILVMELSGDKEGVAKALELWSSPDVTVDERNTIVLNMPQLTVLSNTGLFAEAILDTKLSTEARKRAIQDLGVVGGPPVLEALRKCAETETDPVLKDLASAAAEAVDSRAKQGLVAMPLIPQSAAPAAAPDSAPAAVPAPESAAPAPAPESAPAPAAAPTPTAGS